MNLTAFLIVIVAVLWAAVLFIKRPVSGRWRVIEYTLAFILIVYVLVNHYASLRH